MSGAGTIWYQGQPLACVAFQLEEAADGTYQSGTVCFEIDDPATALPNDTALVLCLPDRRSLALRIDGPHPSGARGRFAIAPLGTFPHSTRTDDLHLV